MAYNVFVEQLRYITKVTELLNELDKSIDADEHHYIDVNLVQQDTGVVVGKWTNEIGPGSWSFEFVEPTK